MRGIIRDIRKWDAYPCLPIPIRLARSLQSTPQFLIQESNTHILMAHYYYPKGI